MSTGDQSQYMRAKMAERGTSQGVQFSQDGFDKWAESTAPARAGQAEKMPAETQMANTGGAMTPSQARKYAQKYAKMAADKAREMAVESYTGGAMCGGRSVNIAGINIEIPEIVEKAVEYGEKVLNFALLVKDKLPEIKESIQDEIIDNTRDPSVTSKDREIARNLLPLLDRILGYLKTLEAIKQAADGIKKALGGSGRHGMRGGASAAENFKKFVEFLKGAYKTLFKYVDFFVENGKFLLQMLKISALQPIGKQILDKIKPILSLGGINVGGRRKAVKCECSDSEEYHGGFMDMFGQQKQEATMMPMQEATMMPMQGDYGMIGGPQSYKGPPMRNEGMQMGQMGDYNMGGPMKYESTYDPPPVQEVPEDSRKMKTLMRQLNDLKRQIAESDSDEERTRLRKRYVALDEKIREMQMRGGSADNSELIKRIQAEISRLKNMPRNRQTTLTERKIQGLEGHLKRLMKTGGGMEMVESVPNNEELIKKIKAEINRLKNMRQDGARATSTKRRIQELESRLEQLTMRGGKTTYTSSVSTSRRRKPDDSVVTSTAVGGRKSSARGEIVKKVMREKGLSLPQASKYVKEHGLY